MYDERKLELISSASKGKQYTLAAFLIAIVQYKENEVLILSWFVFFALQNNPLNIAKANFQTPKKNLYVILLLLEFKNDL